APLFASSDDDEVSIEKQVQDAFPRFAKFQPGFSKDAGISAVGLRYLCSQLAMDISEADLDRLFLESDLDCNGRLSLPELVEGCRKHRFFTNLIGVMNAAAAFRVGRSFDYSRSTREGYANAKSAAHEGGEACSLEFNPSSSFQGARPGWVFKLGAQGLGYYFDSEIAIHVASSDVEATTTTTVELDNNSNYRDDRASWQRRVVLQSLPLTAHPGAGAAATDTGARPWAIFTLATPGALPEEALSWMSQKGLLPLKQLAKVSTDYFVQRFPELPLYVRQHGYPQGTTFLREEAELLEGEALEVAASQGHHVWTCCAPSDAHRLRAVLQALRQHHPEYRIAVLDIRADAAALQRRYRSVVRHTGRAVPLEAKAPAAADLQALAARADFLARIDHSEDIPVLIRIETAEDEGSWPTLSRIFTDCAGQGAVCSARVLAQFPHALRPLRFVRLPVSENVLVGKADEQQHISIDLRVFGSAMGCALTAKRLSKALGQLASRSVHLLLSSLSQELPGGNVPAENAEWFAWLHGLGDAADGELLSGAWLRNHGIDPQNLLICLLCQGCLVHLNKKGMPVAIDVPTTRPSECLLQFGTPRALPTKFVDELGKDGRWQPVAEEKLRRGGAAEECWLPPGEMAAAGAFAYRLSKEAEVLAGHAAIYFEVLN
ncbi:unnamed protein product, partial [Polarella glacialis]